MSWLAAMLTASLAANAAAGGDGQPPVTIIEIPVATTATVGAATSAAPPETAVVTTSPAPATTSPPQIADQVVPTEGMSFQVWIPVALAAGGLIVLALLRRRQQRPPGEDARPAIPVPAPAAAVSPMASGPYEAVEYRSESGTSEVQTRSLGEFRTLEEAIDAARLARSWFIANMPTEAFWVVWDLHVKRAAWIAESSAPGESVIDLRTGRRQPYIAESTKI